MNVPQKLGFCILWCLMASGVNATNLVMVVSKNNPTDSLSKSEVIDIYMGRFVTFPNGSSVQPIDLESGSRIKHQFYSDLLNQSERKVNAYWSRLLFSGRAKPPKPIESVKGVLQYLEEVEHGIAYIPEDEVTQSVKVVYRIEVDP